jgi:hypothetical protein
MADKEQLQNWILEALNENKGSASLIEICKYVWDNYENELRDSGDLFYTWQYDIRWGATRLREKGKLAPASESPRGVWELI